MITTLVSILGTNFFTSVFKNAVKKYGDTGVHLIVLLCSLIASCVIMSLKQYPSAWEMVKEGVFNILKIGAGAIAFYEIAWKKIGNVTNITLTN